MIEKYKPIGDRLLVVPELAEEKTQSGIIIPDAAKKKPSRGKVIATGQGKKDEPLTVKKGDTVVYGQHAGTEIKVEGTSYLVIREAEVFLIIEE